MPPVQKADMARSTSPVETANKIRTVAVKITAAHALALISNGGLIQTDIKAI